MKNNLKIAAMSCCMALCTTSLYAQEAKFTLTVKIAKPYPGQKAFLQYKSGSEDDHVDSATFNDGKFEIKGKTLRPQLAFIYLAPGNQGNAIYHVRYAKILVYLETGHIIVNSAARDLSAYKLGGTPLNNDFQGYADVLDYFKPRLDSLRDIFRKAYQAKDSETIKLVNPRFAALEKESRRAEELHFLGHMDSEVSLDWLKKSYNLVKDKSKVVEFFGKMDKRVKKSDNGKAFSKLLEATQSVEIGNPAPDFTAKNLKEEAVSLNSFRGKYVLLDFWASWCGPCRKENPNVLKAYNAYKSKNFTVIGFSIDSSKSAWEKAVVKDGLPWTQLSGFGLSGDSLPANLYGISAIPSNFLIDPEGKIIATDLRGEELEKALANFIKG